jgi:UPF0716 family protein affecting phage T7 exclusion
MTDSTMTGQPQRRRLSPLWRTAVICFVGLTVSGALIALSLFTRNVDLFVILTLVATFISAGVGVFAVVQGWRGSQRAAARGAQGRSAAIALAAGLMLIVTAVAISGAIWVGLLFFL